MFFSQLEILGNGGGDMKNKLKELMEKDGFILFLFVCVCVVAGGTLFLSMRNINTNHDAILGNDDFVILGEEESSGEETRTANTEGLLDERVDGPIVGETIVDEVVEEMMDESTEEVVEVIAEEELAENNEDLEFEEDNYEEELEDVDLVQEAKTIFLPIEGPILTEYTSNSLIYSETLESWVGHGAIDIEAAEGTIVKAAGDGVVKEVYEDDLWGIVIVIDHGNDLQTRYAGLGTKEMVKVGSNVKKGDHISKVGNTAKVEMLMKPHLHFEVIKNGKLIDPRSIND